MEKHTCMLTTLMPLFDCTTFHIFVSTLSLAFVSCGRRRRGVPAMNLPMLDMRLSGAQTQLMTTCRADFWISASFTNTSPSATARTMLIPARQRQILKKKKSRRNRILGAVTGTTPTDTGDS